MSLQLTTALVLAIAATASADSVPLTSVTFDAEVFGAVRPSFLLFYAPWCGHCKALKPAWNEMAAEYKASTSVLIAEVDCTAEEDLCNKHGVEGFPELKYAESGASELEDFEGDDRSAEGLVRLPCLEPAAPMSSAEPVMHPTLC